MAVKDNGLRWLLKLAKHYKHACSVEITHLFRNYLLAWQLCLKEELL